MASPQDGTSSPIGRKVRRLAIFVAVVIALYTGGWFYGAGKLEGFIKDQLAALPPDVGTRCDNLGVGGFPFLIGVTCERTILSEPANGIEVEAGALRTAARIYMPGQAMMEMDSPARARFGDRVELEGDWGSLRASVAAGMDGLKRASIEGKEVDLHINLPADFLAFRLNVGLPQLHVRDNNGDLDLAILAEKLSWEQIGVSPSLPTLSASLDMTIVGKAGVLRGLPWGAKRADAELRAFKLDLGNGIYGELSGPLSVDDDGWVSGTLDLTLERLDLWEETLNTAFPEASGTVSGMARMLQSLANGKTDKVKVKLNVNRGTVSLSLLPIAHIPQL